MSRRELDQEQQAHTRDAADVETLAREAADADAAAARAADANERLAHARAAEQDRHVAELEAREAELRASIAAIDAEALAILERIGADARRLYATRRQLADALADVSRERLRAGGRGWPEPSAPTWHGWASQRLRAFHEATRWWEWD